MRLKGHAENITVVAPPPIYYPESGEVSQIMDQQAIVDLPLNGLRYTDLALFSPGVTQDPRGSTSGSNVTTTLITIGCRCGPNAYIRAGIFHRRLAISKGFQLSERVRLTLLAESFNVSNRVNQRVDITDDGFLNSAGQFVAYSTKAGKTLYPGEFIKNSKFLIPTNAYSPRQIQFSLRASF